MQQSTLVALFLSLLPGLAAAAPGDVHHVINAATLRAGPGGPEVGTVSARAPVPLVERSRQGGWIETDRGWVWGRLVSPGTSGDSPMANQTGSSFSVAPTGSPSETVRESGSAGGRSSNRMVVSAYASALRDAPRGDAHADIRLSQGSEVTVSKTEDDWAYVAFGDAKGWVPRDHLKPSDRSEPVVPVRAARAEPPPRPLPRAEPVAAPLPPPLDLTRAPAAMPMSTTASPTPAPPVTASSVPAPAATSEAPLSLLPPR